MRSAESKRLDMLHGPIWSKLPQFALPVAATAILEQLFNASDIAVVGNFTGADKTIAVAAVGANSALIALIVNLFIGIALGANVVIANAVGRGDREAVQKAVHTSIVFSPAGRHCRRRARRAGRCRPAAHAACAGRRVPAGAAVSAHLPDGYAGHPAL